MYVHTKGKIPNYSTEKVKNFKNGQEGGANVEAHVSANSRHHILDFLATYIFTTVYCTNIADKQYF